jgi:hypothetical protein
MRARLTIVTALVLAGALMAPAAFAKEQHFEEEDNGQIFFVMPSHNVGCIYTPAGGTDTYVPIDGGPELSCDRIEPSYVNVILGPDGPAIITKNPDEQSCCSETNVFKYGYTVNLDGFTCKSSTKGLTCENPDTGYGFSMARAGVYAY